MEEGVQHGKTTFPLHEFVAVPAGDGGDMPGMDRAGIMPQRPDRGIRQVTKHAEPVLDQPIDLRRAVVNRLGDNGRPAGALRLMLRVHPDVAAALEEGDRAVLNEIERLWGDEVVVQGDAALRREHFDVVEL